MELQFYLESKRLTASALPWRAEIQHFTEWVKILGKCFYGISILSHEFIIIIITVIIIIITLGFNFSWVLHYQKKFNIVDKIQSLHPDKQHMIK